MGRTFRLTADIQVHDEGRLMEFAARISEQMLLSDGPFVNLLQACELALEVSPAYDEENKLVPIPLEIGVEIIDERWEETTPPLHNREEPKMAKKPKNGLDLLTCPECGGHDISVLQRAWVRKSAHTIMEPALMPPSDQDQAHCADCNKNGVYSEFKSLSPYTVILLYPDYASEEFGQDYYVDQTYARSVEEAVNNVRQAAMAPDIKDPTDFVATAVIEDLVAVLLPARTGI